MLAAKLVVTITVFALGFLLFVDDTFVRWQSLDYEVTQMTGNSLPSFLS